MSPHGSPSARLDARRWAGLSGLAAVLLFAAGNAIWAIGMPSAGTAVPEVLEFYEDRADRIAFGGTLSVLSIGVFVVFAAAVRQVLVEAGDELLGTAALAGALLGMAAGLAAESINMVAALRARDDELSGELAQALFEISQIFGSVATAVGLGVFFIAVAAAALRTGRVLAGWRAILILLIGVVLLTPAAHVNVLPGIAMLVGGAMLAGPMLRRPPEPAL
jgi:hypothetical protein